MASVHHVEELRQREARGPPGCFVWGDVGRGNRPKDPPARQILRRIDLLRLPLIRIVLVGPVRMSMAIVTAGRIDEIAPEADQRPILSCQF